MKVIVNKPPIPPPPPPPTYDIIGLSFDQMKLLKFVLGRANCDTARDAGCRDIHAGFPMYDAVLFAGFGRP